MGTMETSPLIKKKKDTSTTKNTTTTTTRKTETKTFKAFDLAAHFDKDGMSIRIIVPRIFMVERTLVDKFTHDTEFRTELIRSKIREAFGSLPNWYEVLNVGGSMSVTLSDTLGIYGEQLPPMGSTLLLCSDYTVYEPKRRAGHLQCSICTDTAITKYLIDGVATILCEQCFRNVAQHCCVGACSRNILFFSGVAVNIGRGRRDKKACESCYAKYHRECRRCQLTSWRPEPNNGYCNHCEVVMNHDVHSYNYNPQVTQFYHSNGSVRNPRDFSKNESGIKVPRGKFLWFGLETEVECHLNKRGSVLQEMVLPPWAYPKHDGSLTNGFEIVTFPATWKHLVEVQIPWYKANFAKLMEMGCTSYNTGTCGFHVHLSRSSFSKLHLLKFLDFFYNNPEFVMAVSMRRPEEINRWASLVSAEKTMDLVKRGRQNDRKYTAINLLHAHSIELRVFRGTLRASTLTKVLWFVRSVWHFTHECSLRDVQGISKYLKFLSDIPEYKALYDELSGLKVDKQISKLLNNPRTGRAAQASTEEPPVVRGDTWGPFYATNQAPTQRRAVLPGPIIDLPHLSPEALEQILTTQSRRTRNPYDFTVPYHPGRENGE